MGQQIPSRQIEGPLVESIVEGDNVTVNNTDPRNPIISATATATTHLVPLTTVVGGVPQLVWDADNQLVFTEVS